MTLKKKNRKKKLILNLLKQVLDSDYGWEDAVKNCDIILHTASPFPKEKPKDEYDLISPAKEGTLRVLNAALKMSINRIILTSSNAAVYDGNKHIKNFNETIWTNIKSKD